MTTVKDIFAFLCEKAPLETQLSFDNAGFPSAAGKTRR